ncbi:MAG TPA: putative O-glycosylation ligase, exosortase A system-associated [Casimicrobiaceae bacterium]|nr:putative O-glycosylation ligase, exosortase A system-associated [Casimicrobiaceae bacterium]
MRGYLLIAIVFVLLPVCLVRPWIGILVWYWIGLMNPHRLTYGFTYTMPFAMMVAGATLLGAIAAKDRRPPPLTRETMLMAMLLAYFTVTTFFAWAPSAAWLQWEKVAKVIFMTFVATMFIYGKPRIRALLLVVVASIGFYGVKGGIWSIIRGGAERVQGPDGSFIDGNTFLGLALNMVIPLLIALARDERRRWLRQMLYSTAALCFVASIFTYSRGAWIGLAVVVPFVLWQLKRTPRIVVGIALAIAALSATALLPERFFERLDTIAAYQEDGSANQRLMAWTVHWNVAKSSPLVGAGFNFESADPDRWLSFGSDEYLKYFGDMGTAAAHSIYFQVLGQHGFVAFFLFVALLLSTFLTLWKVRKASADSAATRWMGTYASGIAIGLLSYAVSGAFLSSAYFDLAWLYFAMAAVLAREVAEARQNAGATARASSIPSGPPPPDTRSVRPAPRRTAIG